MTSDETIRKAARIIRDGDPEGMGYAQAHNVASALDHAGLLAPAPLREEWAVECLDWNGEPRYDRYDQRIGAERMCWEGDRVVRRYVTDWEAT